jgi:hypothetical protein
MGFGDLKSRAGQQTLNQYLADKSYIDGYSVSQADNVIFEAMGKFFFFKLVYEIIEKLINIFKGSAPPADLFHALRFYKHINSFNENERKAFSGLILFRLVSIQVNSFKNLEINWHKFKIKDREKMQILMETYYLPKKLL